MYHDQLYRLVWAYRKAGTKAFAKLISAETIMRAASLINGDKDNVKMMLSAILPKDLAEALVEVNFNPQDVEEEVILFHIRVYEEVDNLLGICANIVASEYDYIEEMMSALTTDSLVETWEFIRTLTDVELMGLVPLYAPYFKAEGKNEVFWRKHAERLAALPADTYQEGE